MSDIAHRETDEILEELEYEITEDYDLTAEEVERMLNKHLSKYAEADKKKRATVDKGETSKKEYTHWLYTLIMLGAGWKKVRDRIAEKIVETDKKAVQRVRNRVPEVLTNNYNYGTYECEIGAKLSTSFELVNKDAVNYIIRNNPDLLPYVNSKTALQWDKRAVNSAVLRGILKGDSIPKIADRLQDVTSMERSSAIRNARTAVTSAENRGRQLAYERAEEMGLHGSKMWVATLDSRTRDTHRKADGQTVGIDELFVVGNCEMEHPADPNGTPEEVYNCRCAMKRIHEGTEPQMTARYSKLGNLSYDDWKAGKNG